MSKGINPAGAEHNKCDILKLLRSAIRLCKLIGDIPRQTAKRDVKKKKSRGRRARDRKPCRAQLWATKRVPIFCLVQEFWGFVSMHWTKWPNPALPAPQSLLRSSFTLTKEYLQARRLKSSCLSKEGLGEDSRLIWEHLPLKGVREPLFWVSVNEASHLSLTRTLWFPPFHYISNEAPQRLFKNVSLTFLKREVDPWLSLRWGLKARLKATVSLLCPLLRPERGTVPPKPNPAA